MSSNTLVSPAALATDSLPPCWQRVLGQPALQSTLEQLKTAIAQELAHSEVIFPADPWRALRLAPLPTVKIVILGQDPYHGPDQAQGLAFSVGNDIKTPPSLRNIFKEIARDERLARPTLQSPPDNDLSRWAEQGILLLNSVLTVRAGQAASHARLGWQAITEQLISAVAQSPQPVAFLLWGNHAQAFASSIETTATHLADTEPGPRLILKANHPSPLSASRGPTPFIGCNHFSTVNQWLIEQGCQDITW